MPFADGTPDGARVGPTTATSWRSMPAVNCLDRPESPDLSRPTRPMPREFAEVRRRPGAQTSPGARCPAASGRSRPAAAPTTIRPQAAARSSSSARPATPRRSTSGRGDCATSSPTPCSCPTTETATRPTVGATTASTAPSTPTTCRAACPQDGLQVLNDDPRPDDLPDAPTGPYAALPPDLPGALRGCRHGPGAPDAAPADPASSGVRRRRRRAVRRLHRRARGRRRGRRASRSSSSPAWRIGSPPSPSRVTAWTQRPRPAPSTPSARRVEPAPRAPCGLAADYPAALARLLHPAARLDAVRRQRQPRVRHDGGAGRLRQADRRPLHPRAAQGPGDRPRQATSARSSSTRAAPAAPGVRVRPVLGRSSSHPRCGRHTTSSASTRAGSARPSPVRCLSERRHGRALQRRPDARLGGRAHRRCSRTSTA